MNIVGIIPARYASSRFPGKPLADIGGKSMIQRVYEQAVCALPGKIVVATDDERIFHHVRQFGGKVIMTRKEHRNGTERCAEACQLLGDSFDAVINIQGDEPFIEPDQIHLVASCLKDQQAPIATLVKKIHTTEEYLSPHVVKIVTDKNQKALYFSRAPIPAVFPRSDHSSILHNTFYKHIGIYGYRKEILLQIVKLPPSPLEQAESLEQLRWLENGFAIYVRETTRETFAVDTPEDLQRLPERR
ncbi:MAG: 3-deoxy-manno-octulosonate cytidylyltransferase [Chitinophagales bacterium]|nr:MAG: 3-deoxy-manno-octulosonate cytidylyltransferase [Chitinophagales bacterium]